MAPLATCNISFLVSGSIDSSSINNEPEDYPITDEPLYGNTVKVLKQKMAEMPAAEQVLGFEDNEKKVFSKNNHTKDWLLPHLEDKVEGNISDYSSAHINQGEVVKSMFEGGKIIRTGKKHDYHKETIHLQTRLSHFSDNKLLVNEPIVSKTQCIPKNDEMEKTKFIDNANIDISINNKEMKNHQLKLMEEALASKEDLKPEFISSNAKSLSLFGHESNESERKITVDSDDGFYKKPNKEVSSNKERKIIEPEFEESAETKSSKTKYNATSQTSAYHDLHHRSINLSLVTQGCEIEDTSKIECIETLETLDTPNNEKISCETDKSMKIEAQKENVMANSSEEEHRAFGETMSVAKPFQETIFQKNSETVKSTDALLKTVTEPDIISSQSVSNLADASCGIFIEPELQTKFHVLETNDISSLILTHAALPTESKKRRENSIERQGAATMKSKFKLQNFPENGKKSDNMKITSGKDNLGPTQFHVSGFENMIEIEPLEENQEKNKNRSQTLPDFESATCYKKETSRELLYSTFGYQIPLNYEKMVFPENFLEKNCLERELLPLTFQPDIMLSIKSKDFNRTKNESRKDSKEFQQYPNIIQVNQKEENKSSFENQSEDKSEKQPKSSKFKLEETEKNYGQPEKVSGFSIYLELADKNLMPGDIHSIDKVKIIFEKFTSSNKIQPVNRNLFNFALLEKKLALKSQIFGGNKKNIFDELLQQRAKLLMPYHCSDQLMPEKTIDIVWPEWLDTPSAIVTTKYTNDFAIKMNDAELNKIKKSSHKKREAKEKLNLMAFFPRQNIMSLYDLQCKEFQISTCDGALMVLEHLISWHLKSKLENTLTKPELDTRSKKRRKRSLKTSKKICLKANKNESQRSSSWLEINDMPPNQIDSDSSLTPKRLVSSDGITVFEASDEKNDKTWDKR